MVSDERFEVRFPSRADGLTPYDEFFYLVQDGGERKIHLHDYAEIYAVPGLYEHVVSDRLQCVSPVVLSDLLLEEAGREGDFPESLRILDFGAGTGLVGARLRERGAGAVVGIDLVESAAEAARRDHPGAYDAYHVGDILCLDPESERALRDMRFNCLVSVSAVDIGHIPPEAFLRAYNMVLDNGWVAFNLKRDLLDPEEEASGFRRMIKGMTERGALEVKRSHRYRHRFLMDGSPMEYVALIGRKRGAASMSEG
jgi:SAM-dependent methyltransferase